MNIYILMDRSARERAAVLATYIVKGGKVANVAHVWCLSGEVYICMVIVVGAINAHDQICLTIIFACCMQQAIERSRSFLPDDHFCLLHRRQAYLRPYSDLYR